MKKIEQYILEHIIKGHLKKQYKYHPKTKKELKEAIQTELDNGNTDLNCIDTSKIIDMEGLFDQEDSVIIRITKEQQKTLDVSKWDVSNVTDMYYMFNGCAYFNSDISNWDVSNVINMDKMFRYCDNFNQDLSKWDVSNVKYMNFTFKGCTKFKSDLSKWNTKKIIDVVGTFDISGLSGNEPQWYKDKHVN